MAETEIVAGPSERCERCLAPNAMRTPQASARPPARRIASIVPLTAGIFLLLLTSCSTTNHLLKAWPAEPSGFLEPSATMNPHPSDSPFHLAVHSTSWEVHERARSKKEIYIAPVDISRLRGIQSTIARTTYSVTGWDRPVEEMANEIRLEFAQAFIDSSAPVYRVVAQPGPDSVTLDLALVELDPTSVTGNAVRKVGSYLLGPLLTVATFGTTAGSIAIEGKVLCSDTNDVVFQFADREGDQLSVFSMKDFEHYGFIEKIIKEWAEQFEVLTRTPPQQKIQDSSWFTLNPL